MTLKVRGHQQSDAQFVAAASVSALVLDGAVLRVQLGEKLGLHRGLQRHAPLLRCLLSLGLLFIPLFWFLVALGLFRGT